MLNTPNIEIDKLKDCQDAYTVIDLLIAGYKESKLKNDQFISLVRKNNSNYPNTWINKFKVIDESFSATIVMLENLEKKIDQLDKLQIMAEEGAGF